MKKSLTIAALVFLALSTVALAESLAVTSQTLVESPTGVGIISSTKSIDFRVPGIITVMVAGKTCNLLGYGGCNYTIIVAPNGSISGSSGNNQGCTRSDEVAASCK